MTGSQTAFWSTAAHRPGGMRPSRLPQSGRGCAINPAPRPGAGARGVCGFTLIEVLITVAIVAILITVALPSYSNVSVRVNRSAATQFMMDLANRQEQYILDQRAYTATIGTGGLGLTPPKDVAASYTFTAAVTGNDCAGNSLSGPGYVITATATGSQARDGNLCLDSRNNKTPAAKWEL
jgi:type IV pilus assembly protein PilE